MSQYLNKSSFLVFIFLFIFFKIDCLQGQFNAKLIYKVSIGESQYRYYLHYDLYGNFPANINPEKLEKSIFAGDELVIRYYPNILFSLKDITIPKVDTMETKGGFIIFPSAKNDTFSVQKGFGAVYFATREKGKFDLRIEKNPSELKIGDTIDLKEIKKELRNQMIKKVPEFKKSLENYSSDWEVWMFENVIFDEGYYTLEIFQVTPKSARLIDRIITLHVNDIFRNPMLLHQRDLSTPEHLPFEKNPELAYFESILKAEQTSAGVHCLNIEYDYSPNSWYFRQVPSIAKGKKLKVIWDHFVIKKERELPSSVRTRVGFAVFDKASEARLISNFVLVLSPEDYFSQSTGFFKSFNPTIGIQIGGTGTQDIIFLLGASFKLINEGDFIFGLRFGRETGEEWIFRHNFYFGASLDPGLWGKLRGGK